MLAWYAEAFVGVAEEAHRAADDVIFAIPLLVIFLLTVRAGMNRKEHSKQRSTEHSETIQNRKEHSEQNRTK